MNLAVVYWLEEAGAIEQEWVMAAFCLGSRLRLCVGAREGCTREDSVGVLEELCVRVYRQFCADRGQLCGVVEVEQAFFMQEGA
jgi:hypothetical protein